MTADQAACLAWIEANRPAAWAWMGIPAEWSMAQVARYLAATYQTPPGAATLLGLAAELDKKT